MTKTFFVTGTDTEVGKTYVTCQLMRHTIQQGHRTLGLKPLALGYDNEPKHEDALLLQQASNLYVDYAEVNPFLYPEFAAPHVAFERAGVQPSVHDIAKETQRVLAKYQPDYAFIEGAGGFSVPLSASESMSDLAAALTQEVILVVGLRLGCLNHALLTHQAIRARGLQCRYWVANQIAPSMGFQDENIALLKQCLPATYLGFVPFQTSPSDTPSFLAAI